MALIGSIGEVNLDALDKSIADTAVDIFVYDTRKDSDGGKWRKRTKKTSWYNETLNTATRGSRREFPAVAVIVAESTQVTIYDGDDPDLPMWMVFNGSYFFLSNTSSIHMINGDLRVGMSTAYGVRFVNFLSDNIGRHSAGGEFGIWPINIAERNISRDFITIGLSGSDLVNGNVNDIAMTVLPNAPIDPATGLPTPTIAVATQGGVSVIKDDGTVVDLRLSNSYCVEFTLDYKLIANINTEAGTFSTHVYDTIPSSDSNTNGNRLYYRTTSGTWSTPPLSGSNNETTGNETRFMSDNLIAIPCIGTAGTIPALNILQDISPQSSAMVAYVTTSYNTGWMHGDIKGAFLSDTDATNVTGSELVTNGTFDTDTTGWTAYNSVISVDSNRLRVDDTANAGGWSSAVQEISTEIGKQYILQFTFTSSADTALVGHYAGSYASAGAGTQPTQHSVYGPTSGTYTRYITATTTTTSIVFAVNNQGVSFFDNISLRKAELNRSVNNKGLQVFGTITKSAVATGSDLVAYSGWSGTNYLEQPYNSDLNFGTGDFSIMSWVKTTSTTRDTILQRQDSISSTSYIYIRKTIGGVPELVFNGSVVSISATARIDDGNWHHLVVQRSGGIISIYVDGYKTGSSISNSGSATYVSGSYTRIGLNQASSEEWEGSIALLRISASAPSAEQIKKIYEDEKVLFQENAKCTLYGSSDAVTALAYDDKTNLLHVGTSSGRSDFKGLRRINNTTTGITTAISASNRLIAEQ